MAVKIHILCIMAVFCVSTTAQETVPDRRSRAYLESLDDVELLIHSDARAAVEVWQERSANYTQEQKDAVMAAYRQARIEQLSRDGATTAVLLERISTSTDSSQRRNAFSALLRDYRDGGKEERAAIRDAFLDSWRALPVPSPDAPPGIEYSRFFVYLNGLHQFFPHEADALPILEERCVESGLRDGLRLMFATLSRDSFEVGPLTAAKAEAVYNAEFQSGKVTSLGGESHALLESSIYSVLGQCGESGMDVLRRMDFLKTPTGLTALNAMHTPEAEELLWEIVEAPDTHPLTILQAMRIIYKYEYRDPQTTRLRRFREPLRAILVAPEPGEKYPLETLELALDMARRTDDSYYHESVVRLEESLDPVALEQTDIANQGEMDPEKFPKQYTSETLRNAISLAKQALRK